MARDLKLQVILDAVDKATRPLRAIQRQTESASTALKEQRQTLKRLQAVQKDVSSFKTLKSQSNATGQALREQQERIKRLSRQMRDNQGDTQALAAERRKAIEQARKLSQRYSDEQQKLQRLRSSLTQSGVDTRQLGQAQQKLTQEMNQANAAVDEQKRKLQQLAERQRKLAQAQNQYDTRMGRANAMRGAGMAGMATGGAALYAGARVLSPGVEYGEQMSAVQAVGRFNADDERFQALKQQSRDLGSSTAFSASEVGAGQEFLLRAGMSAEAIQSSMKDVLNLALANNTELGRTADIASNIAGTFKIDLEKEGAMGHVADVLSATASRANVDLEKLGETVKYLGGAEDLDLTLEQASAMAGLLGNIGIQGSQAGTTLRGMMNRLTDPSKEAAAVIKNLGVQVSNADGEMRDMPDILRDINAATKDLGNADRKQALQKIFGAEAGSGMAELVSQMSTGALDDLIAKLQVAAGENDRMAKTMQDNLGGDLKGLGSAWEEVGISITETNKGGLRELIQNVTALTRGIGNWIKENPELASGLFKAAAGLAALVAVGGALTVMLASILGPIVTVRYGMAMLGLRTEGAGGVIYRFTSKILPALGKGLVGIGRGFIGLAGAIGKAGLALLTNPITWIVLGIVAVVALLAGAAYLIYKNWDAIAGWFSDRWQEVKDAFSGGIGSVMQLLANWSPLGLVWKGITTVLSAMGVEIPEEMRSLGSAIKAAWSGLSGFFSGLWDGIKSSASTAWGAVSGTITTAWDGIKNHISNQWEGFKQIPAKLAGIGGDIMDGLIGGVKTKVTALKDSITGIAGSVKSWFADVLGINSPSRVFAEFGGWIGEGLMNGLKDKWNALKDSVTGLASAVTGWFKEKLDIHSPSRVFAKLGGYTVDGLNVGLDRQRDEPAKRVADIAKRATRAGAGIALGAATLPAAAMPSFDAGEPIRFDTRPPISAAGGQQSADYSIHIGDINVTPGPGMDEQTLARYVAQEVQRALADAQRQQAARRRSSMWDQE
ncbi:phage tail tape measure protein [Salinicola sp. RZ23]|uniref:phage tail tape measure protein n=1 Tax=Salinicola sp. RZ23 TaxID=1949087 RepID=UPI000DA23E06|nr:phage tail tape measure protein [Salinicola sp. RZ23]